MKKYIIIYIIDNKSMPTTQIKPFGVFNGSKTTGQSANYASSSLGVCRNNLRLCLIHYQ